MKKLATVIKTFDLKLIKFIPNSESKFLRIQPHKNTEQLELLTTISELHNIDKVNSLFCTQTDFGFLFDNSAEVLPITKITCIDDVCTELETPSNFHKPILFLEEYQEGFRLTYSKALIPHSTLLNYISIGE